MATNVNWTEASTLKTASTVVKQGIAGEAVIAMQPLYAKADKKLYLGDASAAATALVLGLALHTSAAGQPVSYATSGNITVAGDSELLASELYVLSPDAGGIMKVGNLTASEFTVIIGHSTTATNFLLDIATFLTTIRTAAVT